MPFDLSTASPVTQPAQVAQITPSKSFTQGANLELFNRLPDHVKSMVNSLAEGRIPLAGRSPLSKDQMSQLFEVASAIDPTLDATTFTDRNKARADFGAAGVTGKKLQSMNAAMKHLQNLEKNYTNLDNFNFGGTYLNAPVNAVERFLGVPRVQRAYAGAQRNTEDLAGELANVFRTGGGMSEADIKRELKSLNPNMPPEEMKAKVEAIIHDIEGKVSEQVTAYNRSMGTNKSVSDFLSPEAKAVYERIGSGGFGNIPQTAKPAKPVVTKTPQQKMANALTQPAKINSDEEYNKLPAGAIFVGPDGVTRTKPRE